MLQLSYVYRALYGSRMFRTAVLSGRFAMASTECPMMKNGEWSLLGSSDEHKKQRWLFGLHHLWNSLRASPAAQELDIQTSKRRLYPDIKIHPGK